MKKLLMSMFVTAALVPAALNAAPFEGKVTFKMSAAREKAQEMRYAIKGDKVRIEFPAQKEMGGMIMDTTKQEMLMIMDSQRMYMVMPTTGAMGAGAAQTGPEPKLEKTGKSEKILGYTAEQYVATQDGTKTEFWLTEGLGAFAAFSQGNMSGGRGRGGNMPSDWQRALAGKPFFPLRVIGYDKGNKESFRMEATAIDKQALPDGMFTPPADYQRMDMGAMMQGGMPGGMMPGRGKR